MARRRADWLAVALPAVVVALFLTALRNDPGGPRTGRAIDDLGQLLAAAVAAAACGRRAARSPRGGRVAWLLLAVAAGSWAVGEAIWSWYELVAGRQTPFPSLADAGFLLFDVVAAAALLSWPSTAGNGRRTRLRSVFDGAQIAGSLFIVTWATALGGVVRGSTGGRFAFAVSLAYPVLDLVLLTLTLAVVAHARRAWRSGLVVLAVGLTSLTVADSGFTYLSTAGTYATGSFVDAGWVAGFLLIAAAAVLATPDVDGVAVQRAGRDSSSGVLVPYLPAVLGLAFAGADQLAGHPDPVVAGAAALVIAALLIRQLLATLDNRALVVQLMAAQDALHHRAFHDPLTGLANRALLADRLRHGLELHSRDLRPLTLLYCDLDNLKAINDTLGHNVGDEVLRAAADRLRAVTRAADTVARMGGDEFAILIEEVGGAHTAARRIVDAFAEPVTVNRHRISIAASIGIAELGQDAEPIGAAALLRRADSAMYQAKRSGTGEVVVWADSHEAGQLDTVHTDTVHTDTDTVHVDTDTAETDTADGDRETVRADPSPAAR